MQWNKGGGKKTTCFCTEAAEAACCVFEERHLSIISSRGISYKKREDGLPQSRCGMDARRNIIISILLIPTRARRHVNVPVERGWIRKRKRS